MANYKTVFLGTETSKTESVELQCFSNSLGEIFIQIEDTTVLHDYGTQSISIDISTAIKLCKTLRTHINIIKEDL
jgi:hypothetical protein